MSRLMNKHIVENLDVQLNVLIGPPEAYCTGLQHMEMK